MTVMLSIAKHLAFSVTYKNQILRNRLRMTLRHSLSDGEEPALSPFDYAQDKLRRKVRIGVMVMKRLITSLLMRFVFCSVRISHAVESMPGWQQGWEKTVAAAKKEGRLNLYVGRYETTIFKLVKQVMAGREKK